MARSCASIEPPHSCAASSAARAASAAARHSGRWRGQSDFWHSREQYVAPLHAAQRFASGDLHTRQGGTASASAEAVASLGAEAMADAAGCAFCAVGGGAGAAAGGGGERGGDAHA